MEYKELIEQLKSMLPEKVLYGDLIGAEGVYAHSGPMVYEDPEPYFIEQAITAITDLLARAETAEEARDEERQHRLHAEQHAEAFLKDCESLREKLAAAEAANNQLDGAVTTLMESNGNLHKALAEAEERAEKAERERDAAIQYMRKTFGWCTGCVHFTGIYGSGCKIGEMSTCGEENNRYVFCKEE